MRGISKTLIVAAVGLLLAAGLVACGGGDDSSSTGADAAAPGQTGGKSGGDASLKDEGKTADEGKPSPGGSGQGGGASGGSGEGGSDGGTGNFVPKHHKDSGGGSKQFKVKGGDNSVQEFGAEANTSELDAAATALHNFLDARVARDWAAACTYMAKSMVESLEQLASQAKQVEDTSCGGILGKLTNPAAMDELRTEAEQADVRSLRTEGEQAFVIYTGIDGVVLGVPMANEGGSWKVASLAGTPLQ